MNTEGWNITNTRGNESNCNTNVMQNGRGSTHPLNNKIHYHPWNASDRVCKRYRSTVTRLLNENFLMPKLKEDASLSSQFLTIKLRKDSHLISENLEEENSELIAYDNGSQNNKKIRTLPRSWRHKSNDTRPRTKQSEQKSHLHPKEGWKWKNLCVL